VQVLPLLDGPVGGDPQGPQESAAESVKLAARSAETIVDRILVVVSQLSGFKARVVVENWAILTARVRWTARELGPRVLKEEDQRKARKKSTRKSGRRQNKNYP
jgi:hypothetical protein